MAAVPDLGFGQIMVASELERSVEILLKQQLPAYLREIERQVGWDKEELREPRTYQRRNSFDVLAGEEMPKCVVISPGLWEPPEHPEADGYYRAEWQIGVGVAIAARDEDLADQMVKMYGAAVRGVLIQNQDLGRDDVCYVTWLDENYDDLDIDDQIMLYKAAGVYCAAEVLTAVNRFKGPPLLDGEPVSEPLPTVDTVITEINEDHTVITVP